MIWILPKCNFDKVIWDNVRYKPFHLFISFIYTLDGKTCPLHCLRCQVALSKLNLGNIEYNLLQNYFFFQKYLCILSQSIWIHLSERMTDEWLLCLSCTYPIQLYDHLDCTVVQLYSCRIIISLRNLIRYITRNRETTFVTNLVNKRKGYMGYIWEVGEV